MQVRLPFAILALVAAFGGGLGSSHLIERDARAQSSFQMPQTAAVYVPPEGLAFRALDGRVIARLSYDAHGGSFEVYDHHEHPAAALRAGFVADAPRTPATLPVATVSLPSSLPSDVPDLGY
jgi:hypothetical protein